MSMSAAESETLKSSPHEQRGVVGLRSYGTEQIAVHGGTAEDAANLLAADEQVGHFTDDLLSLRAGQ